MKLLSWGANSYGQLGHGIKSEQCVVPLEIKHCDHSLKLPHILSVAGGGGHTLVLDKDGLLFGCGWNNKGQLGAPLASEALILKQLDVLKNHEIIHVCCGWESSLAVTRSGELFTWGSNAYSEIGLDKSKVKFSAKPVGIPVPNVRSISCGLRHTMMVTDSGQLLACGTGRKGQLGLITGDGNVQSIAAEPILVPGMSNVQNVVCGQHHTVAMTDTGQLYVWGDNRHGQLGLDPALHPSVLSPMEIQPFPKELLPAGCRLYCGWTHTVLVSGTGEVYNWGRNTYGQLGCYNHKRLEPWKPTKLGSVHGVTQMALGSEHNIAVLENGNIMSWGWNEHGNCGNGTEENVIQPTPVAIGGCKAVLIGAGAGHNLALVED